MKSSATLVELIIAITLLALIILAAGTFDIASRYFLRSSETKVECINDLTYVLEHLHKNILQATGSVGDLGLWVCEHNDPVCTSGWGGSAIVTDAISLFVRHDADLNPSTTTGDVTKQYLFKPNEHEVLFFDGANWRQLTDKFIDLGDFSIELTDRGGILITNFATAFNPSDYLDGSNRDPTTNPIVTTQDIGDEETVFFFPLTHSWN